MTREDERAAHLLGQVMALRALGNALAATHRDPDVLRLHFEAASQSALTKLELHISDYAVSAFHEVCNDIYRMLSPDEEIDVGG